MSSSRSSYKRVLCLATGGWFIPFMGSGLIALGTVANAKNSQVEVKSSLHREIEKAKKIIKEEGKEFSEKVWCWLGDGIYVQEALNKINSVDVDEKWKKAAHKLQNLLQNHDQTQFGKSIMNSKIKSIMAELPSNLAKAVADAVGILIATSKLLEEYRPVFGTVLIVKQFGYTVEDLVAIRVQKMCGSVQQCSIVFDIAWNFISLLSSNKDMESVCEESLEIKKVADKLEKQAKMFEGLYYKLLLSIH